MPLVVVVGLASRLSCCLNLSLSRSKAFLSPYLSSKSAKTRTYLGRRAGEEGEEHGRAGKRHGFAFFSSLLCSCFAAGSASTRFFFFFFWRMGTRELCWVWTNFESLFS